MLSSTRVLFVTSHIIATGDTSSCPGPRGGELQSDLMPSFRASAQILRWRLREITLWGEMMKSVAKNLRRTKRFLTLVEYVARAEALET